MVGGFSLPDFKQYYWACHLSILAWWKKGPLSSDETCPSWLSLERLHCCNSSLTALLNSPIKVNKTRYTNSFVIRNTIRIWKQIQKFIKAPEVYFDTPICENHSFAPGLCDAVFRTWRMKGIDVIGNLYINGTFASFAQLCSEYNLPPSSFFRYLQVRDYVRKNVLDFGTLAKHETLEEINRFDPANRGAVSYFYKIFNNVRVDTTKIKKAWEDELGQQLSDELWEEGLKSVQDCSVNARHNLIQFKTLHRLHYSREKLSTFFTSVSPVCSRCRAAIGNLTHSFWLCVQLHSFWKNIFHFFSTAFGKKWDPEPLIAIIGVSSALRPATKQEKTAVLFGTVIAKRLILRFWKKDSVPTFDLWLGELANTLHLERLRYYNEDKVSVFEKIWNPVLKSLQ
uniref:LIN1 n=1 Tax=Poeciliopsis prolifica TaxID=188132 RepID=A0A0S7EX59_9TELE